MALRQCRSGALASSGLGCAYVTLIDQKTDCLTEDPRGKSARHIAAMIDFILNETKVEPHTTYTVSAQETEYSST